MLKISRISATRVVWTSFIVDLADLFLNLVVAILTGSVVVLAETLQGGADVLTSGLLLVGVNQASRRSNRHYRFGYGRELFFWVLISGVSMIAITATLSIFFGLQRFFHPQPLQHLLLAYGALVIGLITNSYALSISLKRLSADHPNLSVWQRVTRSIHVESKTTLILDSMGTMAALFGILTLGLYQITGNQRFDGIGAAIVGVLTAVFAVSLIVEVKELLVGKSAAPETEAEIRMAVTQVVGVKQLLDLRTMYLGSSRILVNIEVHLDQTLRTAEIEQIMDQIKKRVKQQVPEVHHIQVELETPTKRQVG